MVSVAPENQISAAFEIFPVANFDNEHPWGNCLKEVDQRFQQYG